MCLDFIFSDWFCLSCSIILWCWLSTLFWYLCFTLLLLVMQVLVSTTNGNCSYHFLQLVHIKDEGEHLTSWSACLLLYLCKLGFYLWDDLLWSTFGTYIYIVWQLSTRDFQVLRMYILCIVFGLLFILVFSYYWHVFLFNSTLVLTTYRSGYQSACLLWDLGGVIMTREVGSWQSWGWKCGCRLKELPQNKLYYFQYSLQLHI